MQLQLELFLASCFSLNFSLSAESFFLTSSFTSRNGFSFFKFPNAMLGLKDLISSLGYHGNILRMFLCYTLMSVLWSFLSIELNLLLLLLLLLFFIFLRNTSVISVKWSGKNNTTQLFWGFLRCIPLSLTFVWYFQCIDKESIEERNNKEEHKWE